MGLPHLRPRIQRVPLRSDDLAARAHDVFPGGVNHPPRALRTVGDWPRVFARAEGAQLVDADGGAWLDLCMGGGALLLGHAAPGVVAAAARALHRGAHFDAPCEDEVRLGEALTRWVAGMERVRLTVTPGEAVATAVRLARAHTGRAGILKMEGHAHGPAEALQRQALARPQGGGLVDAAGVPEGALRDTWVVPYNDTDALRSFLKRHPGQVAAVVLEPVATRMGVVPPRAGYLRSVRELALEHGALVVFDETTSGLRLGRGGAQEFFGVRPDLTVLGKALGEGCRRAPWAGGPRSSRSSRPRGRSTRARSSRATRPPAPPVSRCWRRWRTRAPTASSRLAGRCWRRGSRGRPPRPARRRACSARAPC